MKYVFLKKVKSNRFHDFIYLLHKKKRIKKKDWAHYANTQIDEQRRQKIIIMIKQSKRLGDPMGPIWGTLKIIEIFNNYGLFW